MKLQRNPRKPNELSENSRETIKRMEGAVRRQIFLVIAILALVFVLIFAMTVAWYTNVTRTNGLQFQTETWGFSEENISIGYTDPDEYDTEEGFIIRQGDSGIIPMRVDNSTSYQTVKAVLNVDKTNMTDELQKRVYFFVDESRTYHFDAQVEEAQEELQNEEEGVEASNSETVSRQYLGKERVNSYTYSIFGGNSLMISENYMSDSPLKWYWVDTLEGYYFRGTVKEDTVTIEEYLCPIEYDLDYAVFGTDEEGKLTTLMTVNKDKPYAEELELNDFLESVFANDGYWGSVPDTEVTTVNCEGKTYYRIKADDEGMGVWAYLMDAAEIAEANLYDAALLQRQNEQPEEASLNATISVTVFNVETASQNVNSAASLRDAINSAGEGIMRLSQPVTLSEPLTITENTQVTIDLNQFSLEYSGSEYSVFNVESGSSLTLLNGSVVGGSTTNEEPSYTASAAVSSVGGTVTLSGITVRGFDSALSVDDSSGTADSQIKLINCDFDTPKTSVLCFGNGSKSEANSRIIIENCTIRSDYIGVSGNGTSSAEKQLWGTELIILNSEIEGRWTALYQPQQNPSYTCITGSKLTGYTGIAVKGGTVDIYSSEINGTGAKQAAKASGSGWTDTGDAVYVEASYGWSADVIIRGTENVLRSEYGYLLQLFGVEGKGLGSITVEQGTYGADRVQWNNIGTFTMNLAAPAEPQEP